MLKPSDNVPEKNRPSQWPKRWVNAFLDSWWNISPDSYTNYHRSAGRNGPLMIQYLLADGKGKGLYSLLLDNSGITDERSEVFRKRRKETYRSIKGLLGRVKIN